MADPARKLPEFAQATDPKMVDPRYPDPRPGSADPTLNRSDPANQSVDDRRVVEGRGPGKGAIVAAIVVVLAILAYMFFAPGTAETPAPGEPATTTTEPAPATPPATEPNAATPPPAEPAPAPAPSNQAPAAPEQPAAPAPSGQTPAPAN